MYGAFVGGVLRGLGELRPMGPGASRYALGPHAEAAFAVEQTFRRQGIGAALFARIARSARHRGVQDLHVRCLMGPTSCRDADVDAETRARRQVPSIHRASARNHPSPRRENESSCSGGLCSNGANCAIPCSYLCRLTIAELGCIGLDSVLGSGFTVSQASCGARRQGTVP